MFDNLRNTFNFDDLLFEKRNREYGAYQLRKKYNSVVFASVLIATLMFCALVILPFIARPRDEKVFTGGSRYVSVQMENFDPPEDQIIVPPAAPPPRPEKLQEIIKYTPPVVVDSIIPPEESLPTAEQLEVYQPEEDPVITGSGSGGDILGGEGEGTSDEPFFMVEVMPSFKGGNLDKFRDWVQKRTNYPQMAIDKKIKGKVFLTFVVEKDGSVSNVSVVQGVDPLIDIEAVRAIQSSPKWTPGLQRGQPVRVRYSMSLNFVF